MTNQEKLTVLIFEKIKASADSIRKQWKHPQGTKTRHFIIDDMPGPILCNEIYNAYPKDGNGFFNRSTFREKKSTSADLSKYDKLLSDITYAFQDKRVVDLISKILAFGAKSAKIPSTFPKEKLAIIFLTFTMVG